MASWEVQCTHRVGVLSNEFDFVICMYDSLLFVISHAVNLYSAAGRAFYYLCKVPFA